MILELFVMVLISTPLPSEDAVHRMLMESEMRLAAVSMQDDTLYSVDALHYDIRLDVSNVGQVNAWTTGYYAVRDTIDTLMIHLRGFSIDSIKLDMTPLSYYRTDSTINLIPDTTLFPDDTVRVDVWYHGVPPSSGSGFNGGLKFNRGYIYVAFDIDGPRSWFPCHDVPNDKATVDQMITVPLDYTVIANGSLISVDTVNSTVTYHWSEQYPIATYLIVFAAYNNYAHIVDTAHVECTDVPVHGWVTRWDSVSRANRLRDVADIVEFFSQIYTPYPFLEEKYANVDVPLGYAMENQTNTFIDMNLHWGNNWNWVLAHELSHQWWGDCVTLATWPDVWLNEGFATYSEAMNAYREGGMQGYFSYMSSIQRRYIVSAPYPPYPIYYPDANITQLYSVVTYQKAASVLHMLRHIVGDSAFFSILRGRIERHAYGNETTQEFQQLCEDVSGMDLDWFFDEWIYEPGHPRYRWNYSVEPHGDSAMVTLSIYQVQSHSFGVPTFKMPIDFRITLPSSGDTMWITLQDSLDFQQFTFYLPEYPGTIEFDPQGWILCTKEFTGVEEQNADEPHQSGFFLKNNIVSNTIELNVVVAGRHTVQIDLVDVSGRVVVSKSTSFDGSALKFDVSSVRQGVYLLNIYMDGKPAGHEKVLIAR